MIFMIAEKFGLCLIMLSFEGKIYIYVYIYVYIYMIGTTSLLVAGAADRADILYGPEIAVAMEEVSNITYIIIM